MKNVILTTVVLVTLLIVGLAVYRYVTSEPGVTVVNNSKHNISEILVLDDKYVVASGSCPPGSVFTDPFLPSDDCYYCEIYVKVDGFAILHMGQDAVTIEGPVRFTVQDDGQVEVVWGTRRRLITLRRKTPDISRIPDLPTALESYRTHPA